MTSLPLKEFWLCTSLQDTQVGEHALKYVMLMIVLSDFSSLQVEWTESSN